MAKSTKSPHIALLRGINVGGKNKLPMASLVPLFVEAGCRQVRTYIQSGNVLFLCSDAVAKKLPDQVSAAIKKSFGLGVPVILRSLAELSHAAQNNPYLKDQVDPKQLQLMCLADKPSAKQIAALDARRSPPDSFVVQGRDIYLNLPNGAARSKLSNAYFDSKLQTVSTARNWNTVLKLMELASELDA